MKQRVDSDHESRLLKKSSDRNGIPSLQALLPGRARLGADGVYAPRGF
jgi:hypothetical protein